MTLPCTFHCSAAGVKFIYESGIGLNNRNIRLEFISEIMLLQQYCSKRFAGYAAAAAD